MSVRAVTDGAFLVGVDHTPWHHDNQARSTSGVRWYETRDISLVNSALAHVCLCLSTSFLGNRQGIESLRYLTWLSRRLIKSWSLMLLFREGKRLVEGTPSLQVQ